MAGAPRAFTWLHKARRSSAVISLSSLFWKAARMSPCRAGRPCSCHRSAAQYEKSPHFRGLSGAFVLFSAGSCQTRFHSHSIINSQKTTI
ncbi:hypothetical protein CBM2609_A100109 [Cupriavidus taiwanensis]|nr:hypothetical protein CBM2604_A80108 [Cupriavidus taiwanensis]SOZ21837.1 hypothetical protein CBM2609_A100109 [Cupriavidus taiwanensis]SOZ41755.1 hypothetical protein CBM2610_A100107 [Cupriavidus taiwanensis]